MEIICRVISVVVVGRMGEVKNSVSDGEAKELICMTHGHELR